MGCGVSPKATAFTPSLIELTLTMNVQLDKWNSRQIVLVRTKFKTGLTAQNPNTLTLPGFEKIFTNLKLFPPQIRSNAFSLFDKDLSGDIDFKEFCYVLTTLIHGSLEEQKDFVGKLFDSDHDSLINQTDMKLVYESINNLSKQYDDLSLGPLPPEKDIFSTKKTLTLPEFIRLLEASVQLDRILEIFEIIPSPSNEYKIIKEICMRARKEKTQKACHVISYKWWTMWYSFTRKSMPNMGASESIKKIPTAHGEDHWFFNEDVLPAFPRALSRMSYSNYQVISADTDNNPNNEAEMGERPGEIDNTDLEGPIKGLLKENLRYMHDYVLIPNEAWQHLWEWYGGGPEFERLFVTGLDGKVKAELYPLVLYLMMAGDNGIPDTNCIVSCIVSKTTTMEKMESIAREKFGKEKHEVRLWYRYMVNGNWEIAKNLKKTVEEFGLSSGDKLMIETKILNIWPRDKIAKDETQWEVNDKIDVYLDSIKTWKEGIISESHSKHFAVKICESNEQVFLPKNSLSVAPYRTHTTHSIQSMLTADLKQKLIIEFKPLANLGNTYF